MRKAQFAVRALGIIVLCLIAGSLCYGYYDVYRMHGQVRRGMSEDEVVRLFGEPTRELEVQIKEVRPPLPLQSRLLVWSRPCGDLLVFMDRHHRVQGKSLGLKPRWVDGSSTLFSPGRDNSP